MDDLIKKGKSMKNLFAKQSDDPAFMERQTRSRHALLKNLSRAVKETQLLYTRTEGGVLGDCRPVQRLCARFEDVLRHELKTGWSRMTGKLPTFWPIVLRISRKQAIEYINRLQYAQTDIGRCRAWIRLAANECSLESYITVLCQDTQLLNQYYEPHSFMRDEETVSAMKQMLTGLTQISFNITVDTASLEFAPAPEALQPALRIRAPQPVDGNSDTNSYGVPSSNSTPQASSSGSSWLSTSSESSAGLLGNHNNQVEKDELPSIDDVRERKVNEQVEVILSGGLEASLHHEDDAVVVEISDTKGLTKLDACTDLRRFSQMMDDVNDKDWMIDEEEEENEEIRERDDTVLNEGIVIQIKEKVEGENEDFKMEDKQENENGENTRRDTLEVSSEQKVLDSEILIQPTTVTEVSPSIQPVSNIDIQSIGPVESPISNDPIVPPTDTSNDITHTPNEQTESPESPQMSGEVVIQTDPETDEYSFTELLRLATGVNPFNKPETNDVILDDIEEEEAEEEENKVENKKEVTVVEEVVLRVDDPVSLVEPPNLLNLNEECVTPKFTSSNPFIHSPTTPVAKVTNPFEEGYVQPEHPLLLPIIEDNRTEMPIFDETSKNPFSPHSIPQHNFNSFNPFMKPEIKTEQEEMKYEGEDQVEDERYEDEFPNSGMNDKDSDEMLNDRNIDLSECLTSEEYAKFEVKEDHFPLEMSLEEIEKRIGRLKSHLRRDSSDIGLKQTLIRLQLMKQELKEISEYPLTGEEVLGHVFQLLPRGVMGKKCVTCKKPLVGLLKSAFRCTSCGYLTHAKCMQGISRKCVAIVMKEVNSYIMDICPEKGLTHQHFRCACCNRALNQHSIEVRLCDYTGHYFCPDCHRNDLSLIPARVLHDWDFSQRRVCSGCMELLDAIEGRPLINIQSSNPSLYTHIHDIGAIELLRHEILLMKPILVECERAREEKLIQELDPWPHFKDSPDMFSMRNLMEIQSGTLLSQVQAVHKMYNSHIRQECETCSSKGQTCAICNSLDILFKFSKESTTCQKCLSLFHRECFPTSRKCPKCTKNRKSRFSTMFL